MKLPVHICVAILSLVMSFSAATAALAQQPSAPQGYTPTAESEANEYLAGSFGFIRNGSDSAANLAGYIEYCFRKLRLNTAGPSKDRSSSAFGSIGQGTSSLQVVPGVVGEVGFTPSHSEMTFMGGPRVTIVPANSRAAIYGEFLFGGLHFSGDFSGTDKLMMPAAGVMVAIPHNKLKVTAEIGWPIDFFDGFHETDTRFLFGVMLPIGGK